jgi:hypothetical protein
MNKFGSEIRDGKNSDPESGINIPDPQHCVRYNTRVGSNVPILYHTHDPIECVPALMTALQISPE